MALCNVMEIQAGHGLRADQHLVMPPPGSTPLVNGLKPNTDSDAGTKIDPDSSDKAKLKVDAPANSLANGDQAVGGDDTIKAEVSSPQDTKVNYLDKLKIKFWFDHLMVLNFEH